MDSAGLSANAHPALHYEVLGASQPEAQPVLLAHAGFLDSRMWRPQIPALTERFCVLTYDARGAGSSAPAESAHDPAADLIAVLDGAGVERAHLVGVSMGAATCLSAALAHPDRVGSLVLVSPGMFDLPPGEELVSPFERFRAAIVERRADDALEAFLRLWFDGRRRPDEVDSRSRQRTSGLVDLRFVYALPHQAAPTVPTGDGPIPDVPVLVLVGEHDWDVIHRNAQQLRELMPDVRHVVMPGTAHLPSLERPDAFGAELLAFLRATA